MLILNGRFLVALLAIVSQGVSAYDYQEDFDSNDQSSWPVITIIIDDIGNRYRLGKQAIELPGPIAYAVLPHTPYAVKLAERAHQAGKEVMLHLPLEATSNNRLLGQGAITLDDSSAALERTIKKNLDAIPHVVGLNNHMGSLLTRHPGHMRWLMEYISQRGDLFFVDSFTTDRSVAYQIARAHGIPTLKRDVFLDGEQSEDAIAHQFSRLKERARNKGYAVAIGHPFPQTLAVLEREVPRLGALGYRLISVESMIGYQQLSRSGTAPTKRLSIHQDSHSNKE